MEEPGMPGPGVEEAVRPAADETAAEQQAEAGPSTSAPSPGLVPCFLMTHSVSKRHNVGMLARSASAFGVKEVCLVGSKQYNSFGAHNADAHVAFRHFPTLELCTQHLKEVEGCQIVGVEICDGARPVHEHPFVGPTAFMLGNEGQGMTPRQMALCDSFVYIPQHGVGTASLNVAVAASIVLHAFAVWAGYPERSREGAKFVVADKPVRKSPRGIVRDSDEAIREQRKQKRLAAAAAAAAAAHAVAGGAAPGDDAGGDLSEGEPEGSQGGEGGGGEEGQAGDEGGDGEGEVEGEGGAALGGRGGAGEKAMCAP